MDIDDLIEQLYRLKSLGADTVLARINSAKYAVGIIEVVLLHVDQDLLVTEMMTEDSEKAIILEVG